MTKDIRLRLCPEDAADEQRIKQKVASELKISLSSIGSFRILRRSIDARRKDVMVDVIVRVSSEDQLDYNCPKAQYRSVEKARQVIIVGAGPAGLFAGLRCLELGLKPIILERGEDVHARKKSIATMIKERAVNTESNYCFGEGGAGAFSDGKLFTRSKKRGPVDEVLQTFFHHGAPERILIDAHPHIGTEKLPQVIEAMRKTIISHGGSVLFSVKVRELCIDRDEVTGVVTSDNEVFQGPVILAAGHSARDLYQRLYEQHVAIEAKGISVGVRVEHPQHIIDQIQYHNVQGRGKFLPPAVYSFATQVDGRGVYSFCMCPGGFIVPAMTSSGSIVVNGMSPSRRNSQWANSGIVVEVLPEDIPGQGPFAMMDYQQNIEELARMQTNAELQAPAQRLMDFLANKASGSLPENSYIPGVVASEIQRWLPPHVATRLKTGFEVFSRQAKGFLNKDALLIAPETRTSSPIRIPRDSKTLQHTHMLGLFPCGEGAGYAGGIVSSAIDGRRCAQAVADYLEI